VIVFVYAPGSHYSIVLCLGSYHVQYLLVVDR
jgi:hypothetical protein